MYMIFLDVKKAYDTVRRARILQLLQLYGVVSNICNIIEKGWANNKLIPKQNKIFGDKLCKLWIGGPEWFIKKAYAFQAMYEP
jgi:hypothetical protein